MKDRSILAASVGTPEVMSEVEKDLRRLGYQEVNERVENLREREYTRRVIVDSMESLSDPYPSIVITWRC